MQNNAHFIPQQEKLYSVAEKINSEIIQHLYRQTARIAIANVLASIFLIFWWASEANSTELIIWYGVITFASSFMLILNNAYQKYNDIENNHLWLHAWVISASLIGCIYGFAFVYFTPFSQAEYAISIGLFIAGLGVAAILWCGISKYSVIGFLMPVMLIPIYSLVSFGGSAGILTVTFIVFFAILIFTLLNSVSNSFRKTTILSFHHVQEINTRKLVEKQLADTNRRDDLTGLYNRRYFDERLDIEIGRAHRNHQSLCVLMVEIDCLKEYSLEHGHVAGENCLVTVADAVHALSNRKGDLLARYVGEEIAIILPNIDATGAMAFANKLQQAIDSMHIPHMSDLCSLRYITISVGVTNLTPFTKISSAELVKNADKALYEAKRQGKNQVFFNGSNGLNHGAAT